MDDVVIHDAGGLRLFLTTRSAASSYGVPVLRVVGHEKVLGDYGPADGVDELGCTAGAWVKRWAAEDGRTAEESDAARRFAGR